MRLKSIEALFSAEIKPYLNHNRSLLRWQGENVKMPPEPFQNEKGVSVARRIIWINDEICPELVEQVERRIRKLNRKSAAPIQVFINSPGGSTTDSLAIYDLFRSSRAPIHATVIADAASGASIVLLGGDKRRILANSRIFIHNVTHWLEDKSLDHRGAKRILEGIKALRGRLLGVYCKHLKANRGKIIRWMDKETYFYADEALRIGFVHEIVKSQKGKPFPKKPKKKRG